MSTFATNNTDLTLKTILLFCAVIFIIFLTVNGPIPQAETYHSFADQKTFWGINNFSNVVSNFPFLLIGLTGIFFSLRATHFLPAKLCFFIGIFLTGIGSAYYHYDPSVSTLVWDRLPMTISFMSFFSLMLCRNLEIKNKALLLIISIGVGIMSVIFWYYGELAGQGDLRPYAFVQFYPIVSILVIVIGQRKDGKMLAVLAWYVIAKIFEMTDNECLTLTNIVSGHTLKHLAASCTALHLLIIFLKEEHKVTYKFV